VNSHIVWPAAGLTALSIIAATVMSIAGVSVAVIVTIMGLVAMPVITTMIAAKQSETGAVVQQVKEQTNGNMTELLSMVKDMSAQLAASQPPLPPLSTITLPPAAADQDQAVRSG
jgi:ABC-type transport system involved in cytochrome bd biosynthesis fused ATPase/permease subunit